MERTATNIKWDTDGESVDLPTEVIIPIGIGSTDEEIGNYLSDEYGWCVLSFEIEKEDE